MSACWRKQEELRLLGISYCVDSNQKSDRTVITTFCCPVEESWTFTYRGDELPKDDPDNLL